MKRYILFVVMVLLLLPYVAGAKKSGRLSVSASVSVYNPPGDVGSTLLFEVSARYRLSDRITSELSVGWTQYESGGQNVTLMPIQLNGEFHPLGATAFDPYLGAGVGAYLTQIGDETSATMGVQMLAGLSFAPTSGFKFSAEVKYMLSDITDGNSGGLSFGGGVEGNWETEI